MKEAIRRAMLEAGASAVGFAEAAPIDAAAAESYRRWIGEGCHAGMDYLERHAPLKLHPCHVLEDAATVVSMAFSYVPDLQRDPAKPAVACYAWGEDYHDVIRKRLSAAVEGLQARFGGSWRICVDTAPLPERYWALRSGIGRKGKNGSVIVDNCGSLCFLAEVLTSHSVAPDEPSEASCMQCGACTRACPTGALMPDGTVDARKCLSYLTIEHRGEWIGEGCEAMDTPAGRHTLYGCDICQRVCPHNNGAAPSGISEFHISEKILNLDAEKAAGMTQHEFSAYFKGSAIKRCRLDGLRRNALHILKD